MSPVNSTAGLAELQKNHSVLFLIVHDEELDSDWHSIYMKQARDKALRAKFAYTTNPDIVSVCYVYALVYIDTEDPLN